MRNEFTIDGGGIMDFIRTSDGSVFSFPITIMTQREMHEVTGLVIPNQNWSWTDQEGHHHVMGDDGRPTDITELYLDEEFSDVRIPRDQWDEYDGYDDWLEYRKVCSLCGEEMPEKLERKLTVPNKMRQYVTGAIHLEVNGTPVTMETLIEVQNILVGKGLIYG